MFLELMVDDSNRFSSDRLLLSSSNITNKHAVNSLKENMCKLSSRASSPESRIHLHLFIFPFIFQLQSH